MSLHILATGGTFDKHYDEIAGKLSFGASYLPVVIQRTRMTVPVSFNQLPLKDSLDMQDEDRQRILEACQGASEDTVVVIHGTDTMRETGEVLGRAQLNKTIVLTGAMIPYEILNSDALFNLGFACGVAQTLPPGVYIAMNGQVFNWERVEKNRVAGVFQVP